LYLKKISLKNFRNFIDEEEEFEKGVNVFVGKNAQGKTNLLESIYYCAFGRSFRTKQDRDLVNYNFSHYIVRALAYSEEKGNFEVKLIYRKDRGIKEGYINGVKCENISQIMGKIKIVIFYPDHLLIVKGPPAGRRRYLDGQMILSVPSYYHYFRQYNNILKNRNALLSSKKNNGIWVWDEQLALYGSKIMSRRIEVVENLSKKVKEIYNNLTEGRWILEMKYTPSLGDITPAMGEGEISKSFLKVLDKNRDRDERLGFTTSGPHRDDICFFLNGRSLKDFGSQGQHRLAVLALKLAEAEFIKENTGESPILLLDDVVSELDFEKRQLFFKMLRDCQVFITTADLWTLEENFLKKVYLWEIIGGKIKKISGLREDC